MMKYTVLILLLLISAGWLRADEEMSLDGEVEYMDNLGDGEYMTDDGDMIQMERLDSDTYLNEDGSVEQYDDLSDEYGTGYESVYDVDRE